jgi:MFS family permease
MLASLAPPEAYGRAFGLERAGDNLGAVAGPLLAAGLVAWLGLRPALYLAAVPGVFAALSITVAAREARRLRQQAAARTADDPSEGERPRLDLRGIRSTGLARPLVPIAAFELGNMATTLLILRATSLLHHGTRSAAAATSLAVLIYAGHNLLGSVAAYGGGHWLDRAGARRVFASGALLYIAAYALFALPVRSLALIVPAFLLAGGGIGFAETAESALVASMLPDRLRGSGFGLLGAIESFGAFASSAVVGLLWAAVSPSAGFAYAAAWMLVSAVAMTNLMLRHPPQAGR